VLLYKRRAFCATAKILPKLRYESHICSTLTGLPNANYFIPLCSVIYLAPHRSPCIFNLFTNSLQRPNIILSIKELSHNFCPVLFYLNCSCIKYLHIPPTLAFIFATTARGQLRLLLILNGVHVAYGGSN
jgi:hypothetical protein